MAAGGFDGTKRLSATRPARERGPYQSCFWTLFPETGHCASAPPQKPAEIPHNVSETPHLVAEMAKNVTETPHLAAETAT